VSRNPCRRRRRPRTPAPTLRRHQRRGGIYVFVLGSALLVMTIGLTSLLAARGQGRYAADEKDLVRARFIAQSGIELQMLAIGKDHAWRSSYGEGLWAANQPLDGGFVSLYGSDPYDADPSSGGFDPIVLSASARYGAARYMLSVQLIAPAQPLELLSTGVHATGPIQVKSGTTTVIGGPLSTNGNARIDGTLEGDLHAATRSGSGTVTGTSTVPAPAKPSPPSTVVNDYIALSTALPSSPTLERVVLSPASNPYGAANANGVYRLVSATDVTVRNLRVHGTLIIRAIGKKVILENSVFLQSYRADYPALLIEAKDIQFNQDASARLSENALNTNFNPAGTPYNGVADTDQLDLYPCEIRGFVHVIGDLETTMPFRLRGVLFCSGTIKTSDTAEFIRDPRLYVNPPVGYIEPGPMKPQSPTWTRSVWP
jgi:hypothetical protein